MTRKELIEELEKYDENLEVEMLNRGIEIKITDVYLTVTPGKIIIASRW